MNINEKVLIAKKRLLTMHFRNKVGHIGGNLSALDALMVLHHQIMTPDDKFILSKGHAAGALYITLWSMGILSDHDLETFHADDTKLAGHPMAGWLNQIPVSTGSLGHGFSLAVGIALGRKLLGQPGQIYCLTSDGEWQEGSNWEALIFFAHHQLVNLTVLIDSNGLQGFGRTEEIASMSNLRDRIKAFNIAVIEEDGHDLKKIESCLPKAKGKIVILNTIKGAGISFMENKMEWHYLPMDKKQYQQAIMEIDNAK